MTKNGAASGLRLPLEGVRIVAIEQFGAGPFGTMHLADLGAEVLKIENPLGGDVSRSVPPYLAEDDSLYFNALNRNKKSIALDITTPDGQRVLRQAVAVSDCVYSNLRGDLPAALGLTYASLKDVNPRIVCCALTGFGMTGPRAAEPGYDYLMQAYAGLMSLTGDPGTTPTRAGVSIIDFTGGFVSALALVAALHGAQRSGQGCDVDISLHEIALSLLSYLAVFNLNKGYVPERQRDSAHPLLYPSQVFQTADGHIVLMCLKEKFWQELCTVIDAPELREDPRFLRFPDRLANRDELLPILQARMCERTTTDWLATLRGRVPCAPVNDVVAALQDEQVAAREVVIEVESANWGTIRQIGNPMRVVGREPRRDPAPRLGEHTDWMLRELLDYDDAEIDRLRANGVVGVT